MARAKKRSRAPSRVIWEVLWRDYISNLRRNNEAGAREAFRAMQAWHRENSEPLPHFLRGEFRMPDAPGELG